MDHKRGSSAVSRTTCDRGSMPLTSETALCLLRIGHTQLTHGFLMESGPVSYSERNASWEFNILVKSEESYCKD